MIIEMSHQTLPSFTSIFGEDFIYSTILLSKDYTTISSQELSSVPLYNSGKFISFAIDYIIHKCRSINNKR